MATRTFEKEIYIDQKAAENMVKAKEAAKKRPKEERIDIRASIERSISLLPKTLRKGGASWLK